MAVIVVAGFHYNGMTVSRMTDLASQHPLIATGVGLLAFSLILFGKDDATIRGGE